MYFKSIRVYNYIKNINIYKIVLLILVLMTDKWYIIIMLKKDWFLDVNYLLFYICLIVVCVIMHKSIFILYLCWKIKLRL